MNPDNIYNLIATAALDRYDLVGELRFIGHSENVTFGLNTPTEKFLLRIHRPISGIQSDIWQKPEAIASELMWLEALSRETEIVVQEPVKNLQDGWVTQVAIAEDGEMFYCSLLHWVEGEILDSQLTPAQAYQLGLLIARLHSHGNQWQPPQNFVRPAYDRQQLQAALAALYPAVEQGLITAADYQELKLVTEPVGATIEILSQQKDTWGLIHADLHDGNYLSYQEEFRPIDFARCGFGCYLYDLASSLQYLQLNVRAACLEGYVSIRKLPSDCIRTLEGFLLAATIDVSSFHINNPQESQHISESVPYIVRELVRPYLESESFLFNKY